MGRIKSNLASRVKKGKMSQAAADAALGRVRGVLDYEAFRDCDMVIEAVIEVSWWGCWRRCVSVGREVGGM
jgi:enoyl-CoA hydratase/3-hydroxyacyl-CoA dehydrogenase